MAGAALRSRESVTEGVSRLPARSSTVSALTRSFNENKDGTCFGKEPFLSSGSASDGSSGRRLVIHGVLPFGVAAIDRVLPDGGLARGALHEILGMGGDEEDGALAAAFAAGILGRLTRTGDGTVLWCLPRPDLYGPGLAAHGLDPARLVLVRASRDAEILWAMEEGLRAPGIAAVVGEVGTLAAVASRRLQLAAERSGITAFLLRRWRDGGQAARERNLPNAAVTRWRIAALPSQPLRGEPGVGTPAVAGRAVALPRRRAGMLGSGGGRCDGSCISGCRAGRSTGGTCLGGKIPARRLKKPRSRRSPMPPDGGFSPRSTRPQLRPAWHRGCRWRMRSPFFPASPPPRPSPRRTPLHSAGWRNGAAATARGPLPTGRTG